MVSNCIRPGTVSDAPYNHYSLLRSVEHNFGLPYLGYAGQAGLRPFGEDVLNRPGCSTPCRPHRKRMKHHKHRHAAEAKKHKKHMQRKCEPKGKHHKQKHR
jgi:hypothetical protein